MEKNNQTVNMDLAKEQFVTIFKEKIKREGSDKLLEHLLASDFFRAPASTKYHLACPGGLAQHSLNVYAALCSILESSRYKNVYGLSFSEETIAIVALLHDICKQGVYQETTRNVKEDGVWKSVPFYTLSLDF